MFFTNDLSTISNRNKIFLTAISIYLPVIVIVQLVTFLLNDWKFHYLLDDTYIHMSIAKNLVQHGTWGINPGEFASASSSPLWILLLSAAYFISGISLYTPYILNLILQIIIIYFLNKIFEYFRINKFRKLYILLIVLAAPLPVILFEGLEHSAHILLALLFLFYSSRKLTDDNVSVIKLSLITFVFAGLRYESLFMIGIVCMLLTTNRQFKSALIIFISASLPVILYGLFSLSNGWYFIPNSILLKSSLPALSLQGILQLSFRFYKNITEPQIFILLISAFILFVLNYREHGLYKSRTNSGSSKQAMLTIFIFSLIAHMLLGQNGGFFRYEAYLVACGLLAVLINFDYYVLLLRDIYNHKKRVLSFRVVIFILILLLSPIWLRTLSFVLIPPGMNNTYKQHYFLGEFIRQNPNTNIAINDIGIMSYYSNARVTDLWGLANKKVASDRLSFSYNSASISEQVRNDNAELCILYEDWYKQFGGLPADWIKIGDWYFTDYNLISGSHKIDFYVPDKNNADKYRNILKEFFKQLPNSVQKNIY